MDFLKEFEKYKDEYIKDLSELLKIESVLDTYNPKDLEAPFGKNLKKALDFMLDLGKKNGFNVKSTSNYAGHIEYGSGDEIIGILCHLDVMPAGDFWETPAFNPTIIENRIYARGAMDDKGPLMSAFYALKMLKDNNIKLKKRVRLIFGLDEESGSRCIKQYLKEEEMPTLAFSPDAEFPLINGEKGIVSFDILGKYEKSDIISIESGDRYNVVPDLAEAVLNVDLKDEFLKYVHDNNYDGIVSNNRYIVRGKSAHAMSPQKGLNGISILVDFLKKYYNIPVIEFLDKYFTNDNYANKLGLAYKDDKMEELTQNLSFIHYNENGLKIGLNYRYPVSRNLEDLMVKIDDISLDYGYESKAHSVQKMLYVDESDPLVVALMKSYNKYIDDGLKPRTIGGGTYSKALAKCVAFGPLLPNREDTIHKPNEYAIIDDLILASLIYKDAIINLEEI